MVTRLVQQNQTQEKILDAAAQLFYEKGVQAVGVDEIVLQAGIAKMTLYKYFLSKDQLIMAVVERSEEIWWEWFVTELNRRSKVLKKQLLIIFDLLQESFQQPSYKGEPFANARIRIGEVMYPIFLVSEKFFEQLRGFILDKIRLAGIPNPNQVMEQFMVLIMGINVLFGLETGKFSKNIIRGTKKLAAALLKENDDTLLDIKA